MKTRRGSRRRVAKRAVGWRELGERRHYRRRVHAVVDAVVKSEYSTADVATNETIVYRRRADG